MSEVDEHPLPLEVDDLAGLPGLKMNAEGQLALFRDELAPRAREIELPRDHDPAWRFSLDNWSFPIGDALVYGSILRYLKPKQVIEVGSGWTTGLALDINDKYLGGAVEITAIEPYPEVVRRIIRREDHIKIIDSPVQSVSLDLFRALGEGDILFIDSSHVLKFGSDVYHILTRILPSLSPGVVIHFHDVFWPFEYPSAWLKWGRAWNESYAVRAFLLFNTEFQVMFFNDWFPKRYRSVVLEEAPALLENAGGSLWVRRAGGASG
ncbi:MAG: class I SAM-dependent methyltransferase [Acidimicrobiales bacterium]|nr:class I SAM-dependent methyltransferase [Acidimicrobiales bacterium]